MAAGLHRALQAAERAGDGAVAARARLALAYVEELAGRYDRAERWLEEAAAGRPPGRLADEIAMAHARCRLDRGHYAEGRAPLRAVLAGACERGDRDLEMWSRIQLGRASLLQGEVDEAIELLRDAAADGRAAGLTAYVPLPLSLLGRALMQRGDHDAAREALEHGLALGTQVQDPCWQGLNLAGLGLLAAAEGDVGAAIAALEVARRLAVRGPVTSVWVLAHVSDALCAVAVEHDVPQAQALGRRPGDAHRAHRDARPPVARAPVPPRARPELGARRGDPCRRGRREPGARARDRGAQPGRGLSGGARGAAAAHCARPISGASRGPSRISAEPTEIADMLSPSDS